MTLLKTSVVLVTLSMALPAGAVGVDELVAIALRDNPRVLAARQKLSAARQMAPQVESLDDPQVGVAWYLQPVETRVGPQEGRLFLSQRLPFWGKRGLRGEAANQMAEASAAAVREVELAVATEVRQRYFDLAYVEEGIRVTQVDRSLVSNIVEAALAHYRAGHGRQRDVLRAQVALSRDTDRLLAFREQRTAHVTRLNALLGRDKITPIDGAILPETLPELPTLEALRDEMIVGRPRLAALTGAIEADRARVELARKAFFPDLTARLDYTLTGEGPLPVSDSGDDAYWVTLGINLPLWRKRLEAGVAEARANLGARRQRYEEEFDRGEMELVDLRFRLATSLDQVALFDTGLVPQAEQALRATMDGYRTGEAGFLDLLDAEREWLDLKLAAFRARADLFQQQALLEQAVGRLDRPGGSVVPGTPSPREGAGGRAPGEISSPGVAGGEVHP